LETFVVKFVGRRPRGSPAENCSHRNNIIFFGNVLVNDVVGEASEGTLPAEEKNFDFLGSRMLLDAFEDASGLVLSKHSALSIQQPALRNWHCALKRNIDAEPNAEC
jgi:hypothetical protein